MRIKLASLLLAIIFAAGCQTFELTVEDPTPTKTAEPTFTPIKSSTPLPTSAATATPSPSPTPTPTPEATHTPELASLLEKVTDEELETWLVSMWLDRQDPDYVHQLLVSAGRVSENSYDEILEGYGTGINSSSFFTVVDINGDGHDEWIISLVTGSDWCALGLGGALWIVNGQGRVYQLYPIPDGLSGTTSTVPAVEKIADLTGDGLPEIVTVSIYCTVHTPFHVYHVLSGSGGSIENVVVMNDEIERTGQVPRSLGGQYDYNSYWSDTGISISNPRIEITDIDSDRVPELILSGGTFNSAGAGCVRPREEFWAWDGQVFTLTEVRWDETDAIVYRLYEANYAFALGNFDSAIASYENVMVDTTLKNYEGCFDLSLEGIRKFTQQYAAFRLVLLDMITSGGNPPGNWYDWLQNNHPEEPLAFAARVLVNEWVDSQSIAVACRAATEYLETTDNPLGPLTNTGYGNPYLSYETVCPIQE